MEEHLQNGAILRHGDGSFRLSTDSMLLAHFARGAWLPKVLEQLEQVTHTGYYVKMAVGWAVSVCYIQDADFTWDWLQTAGLDAEAKHKALQKIMDSRRVTGENRERIRQLREQKKKA